MSKKTLILATFFVFVFKSHLKSMIRFSFSMNENLHVFIWFIFIQTILLKTFEYEIKSLTGFRDQIMFWYCDIFIFKQKKKRKE